ncbi:MAG: uracil-DNA glycosylase [Gemmatimonadota bacterium]
MAVLQGHRRLVEDVITCRRCPRLVAWREAVAAEPRAAFRAWTYWARPVPGFGDPCAWLWIVGLAPAAHGGNRTGRVFTGDRSGEWLFGALNRAGLASQAVSETREDGLRLHGVFIGACARCAPPQNRPLPSEIEACSEYLLRELELLRPTLRVVVALGKIAFDQVLRLHERPEGPRRPRPRFGHLALVELGGWGSTLLGSYHPSQQNTFTGKLTRPMLDAVFRTARELTAAERAGTGGRTASGPAREPNPPSAGG